MTKEQIIKLREFMVNSYGYTSNGLFMGLVQYLDENDIEGFKRLASDHTDKLRDKQSRFILALIK